MSPGIESELIELARLARESNVFATSASGQAESDVTPAASDGFDDVVWLWALASSTCGGLDACIGSGAEC